MKSETAITMSGIIMIFSGFIVYYSIENIHDLDSISLITKHAGIFVGLLGIGVTIAGILLRLMGREQVPIQEIIDN